ncbi:MAG: DUF4124 domain-containing protein [Gallionella sp.]|jgi:hypothetical protein
MKLGYLLLCLIPSLALADIYKSVDADGHVTYSSSPIKGSKRVIMTAPIAAAAPARSSASPHDFPKINEETQKGRDGSRRKILEDELKTEEGLLNTANQSLQVVEEHRPRDDGKIKELHKQADLHQGNVTALKTEISKLK